MAMCVFFSLSCTLPLLLIIYCKSCAEILPLPLNYRGALTTPKPNLMYIRTINSDYPQSTTVLCTVLSVNFCYPTIRWLLLQHNLTIVLLYCIQKVSPDALFTLFGMCARLLLLYIQASLVIFPSYFDLLDSLSISFLCSQYFTSWLEIFGWQNILWKA